MTNRLEFGSTSWMDMVEDELRAGITESGIDLSGVDLVLCEHYTNAPAHLCSPGESSIAWHIRIDDSAVALEPTLAEEATFTVIGDYAAIEAIARTPYGPDGIPDEPTQQRIQELFASGAMSATGDHDRVLKVLGRVGLHNRIAARTA